MFSTGDIVKFGPRGQVDYTVEVIGIDDTVMIRKVGSASARLQSGIKTSRLVLSYPVETELEVQAKRAKRAAQRQDALDGYHAEALAFAEETRRQDAVIASLTRIGKAQAEIEVPTPVEITREQARHQRFAASLTKDTVQYKAPTEDRRMRPKGAQATKYGQAMREALARKNRRHAHA